VVVPLLPVPNLGYACLILGHACLILGYACLILGFACLQAQKPLRCKTRGAILSTIDEKDLVHISQLALHNCKDLLPILQWNHEHNCCVCLFRYVHAIPRSKSSFIQHTESLLLHPNFEHAARRFLLQQKARALL